MYGFYKLYNDNANNPKDFFLINGSACTQDRHLTLNDPLHEPAEAYCHTKDASFRLCSELADSRCHLKLVTLRDVCRGLPTTTLSTRGACRNSGTNHQHEYK